MKAGKSPALHLEKARRTAPKPDQQPVTGFAGRGLVNTYLGGDGPQGTATSKTFSIQRRYIGFLIGGGDHPGQTCLNLRVAGKVVRTATGKNREALEPASWDVAELKGQEAVIEIVDHSSEPWGHINIDQIIFSDVPPEPLLTKGTAAETAAQSPGREIHRCGRGDPAGGRGLCFRGACASAELEAARRRSGRSIAILGWSASARASRVTGRW